MKNIFVLIKLLFIYLLISSAVNADVPSEQVGEVRHLLDFVENSGCVINRNGSDHPAEEGVAHIKMKYDYFRDDIKSTEDFIELSATKSTMSGDYYMVRCSAGEAIRTRDWLLSELKRFRSELK